MNDPIGGAGRPWSGGEPTEAQKARRRRHAKKIPDERRTCSAKGCNTVLSVYNPQDRCSVHFVPDYTQVTNPKEWR